MNLLLASAQFDLRLSLEILIREENGVNIVGSASESEGLLALAQTTQPDLVIIDAELPGRNYLEMMQELKSCASQPAVIVLCSVAQAPQDLVVIGEDAFVQKGCPPDQLLSVIRDFLEQRKAKSQPDLMPKLKNKNKPEASSS